MNRNAPSYVAVLAFAALAALAACKGKGGGAADGGDLPVRSVRAQVVGTGDVVTTEELIGELEGIEEVRVFPQVADRVRKVVVKEGEAVNEGDVLAIVHSDLQSEGVNQAQAALEAAKANRDAIADTLQRTRELTKAGSATQSQLQAVEAQYRAADAQVRQASAGLGQASTQRSRAVIRAPISGVVAQVTVKEGDMASPAMPLMTLVRDQRLKAVFRAPERDFLKVKEGQKVSLHPLADESVTVEAQVTVKGPVVDRMTRTGLVEVHVENAGRALVAGSSVRGVIELGRRPGVVMAPAEAILFTSETERTGAAVAFVTDGKTAKKRDVKVGARQGGQIEIVEGLKPGEMLVVQGAHFLRDGSPVKVAEEQKVAAGSQEKSR